MTGEGKRNKRKRIDGDIEEDKGRILPCATCSGVFHEACAFKPAKKDKMAREAAISKCGVEVVASTSAASSGKRLAFQCMSCYLASIPTCSMCSLSCEEIEEMKMTVGGDEVVADSVEVETGAGVEATVPMSGKETSPLLP